MSVLIDSSITIYEALQNIKDGKYVMPAFQRKYVWSMEQIEKLWDSILLDYPIATFLFWHVDDDNVTWDTYFCNFLSSVTFDSRKQADSVNYELSSIDVKLTDTAVLDGQQRLTSLYLSLFGDAFIRQKHARKKSGGGIVTKLLIELNKNKLTVDEEEYNSKKYDIKFSEKVGKLSPTQFEIRKILEPKFRDETTRENAIEDAIANVPADSKDYARGILNKLYEKIFVEKLIRYTEIRDMKQDDALEMFVRFNSDGKALRKDLKGKLIGRGAILKNDEVPNYERFLPKEEYIKEDNRFSPPHVEWLYLAIGDDNDIHECAQAECRVKKGNRFGFCHFQLDAKYNECKLVDLTIADDVSYAELNAALEEYGQAQVKKGIKIAKALGFVPKMSTNKKEFEELFTRWGVYTYTKLLSEQIFEPLNVCDNKAIAYAPFQTMAQYYISLGYSGIVYGSTVCPVGKNIVLFDKHMACPVGTIEDYKIS